MIINSVKLENIRSYTNEMIEFPEGSTLLSGDIGSGKSTILLAIEFALFGLKKGAGNSLLRHGKKEGGVEVRFKVDNKNVVIKRVLKRSRDDARQTAGYIVIDNIKSDLTPIEIKSKVIELLGYPKDSLTKKDLIYTYTVYTPQEQMKEILSDDVENRLEILRKVFGIDKYKRIRDNCGLLIRDVKERRAKLEGKSENLEIRKKEKEEIEKESRESKEKLEKININLEKARKSMFESKSRLREFENKVYRLNNIKKDLEHSERSIDEKRDLLKNTKQEQDILSIQIETLKRKIVGIDIGAAPLRSEEDIEKEISEKQEHINHILKKRELIKEKLNNNAEQGKEVNKRIEEIEKSNEEQRKKKPVIDRLKQEIEIIDKVEEDIEKSISLLQEITGKISENKIQIITSKNIIEKIKRLDNCPTCMQKVSDMHKRSIIKKETTKTKEHKVEMLRMDDIRKEKEALLKKQKQKHSELLKKQNMLERLNAEIKRLYDDEKRIESERGFLDVLRDERNKLKVEFEQVLSIDIEKLRKMIANFKKMLEIIRSNKMKEKEKENMVSLVKEKEEQTRKLDIQEKNINEFIEDKKRLINELKENIKELGEAEEIYNKLKNEFDDKASEEKNIEVEKAALNSEMNNIKRRAEELGKEIIEKEDAKKEVKRLSELQNWIDNYFVSLMGIIEKQVMANIFWQFNELFQQWFNQLMEDETINARIDEQFTPVIEQNGYDTKIDFLSGGEKTSAALAYRLALNKVINKLVSHIKTKELIILDEPTDGFSSEQLDKVRVVLEDLDVKQLIMVSHESKIESFVDNVIRINKNEHESKVV
ncbi:SMC family ATPase [Candidatus Woesearchaeota archaeon]|nr:SMC family ATPase [Candidatus Woesearchaeota archaeon]